MPNTPNEQGKNEPGKNKIDKSETGKNETERMEKKTSKGIDVARHRRQRRQQCEQAEQMKNPVQGHGAHHSLLRVSRRV